MGGFVALPLSVSASKGDGEERPKQPLRLRAVPAAPA